MSRDIADIQQRLDDILSSIANMKQVLRKESDVLSARDAARLQALSDAKESLARNINQQTDALNELLSNRGLPAIRELAPAVRNTGEAGARIDATWQEIAALAKECEEQNDLNGAYVGLLRQHVQRSLDVLHDRPAQDITYGPDGVGQRPASSRKLLSV